MTTVARVVPCLVLAASLCGCPHDWSTVSPRDGAVGDTLRLDASDVPPPLDVPQVDVPRADVQQPDTSDVVGPDALQDVPVDRVIVTDVCVPGAEMCNGRDDNCNGIVDEGFGPESCGLGLCAQTISSTCVSGTTRMCVPGPATLEPCLANLVDDDCDGVVDNNRTCDGQPAGASNCTSYGCCTTASGALPGPCATNNDCGAPLHCEDVPTLPTGEHRCCI